MKVTCEDVAELQQPSVRRYFMTTPKHKQTTRNSTLTKNSCRNICETE